MALEGHNIKEILGIRLEEYYMSLKALSAYSGLSERKLKAHLHNHHYPIPHFKVGGRVLVKKGEFDRWLEFYRNAPLKAEPDIQRIVEEVMADLKT